MRRFLLAFAVLAACQMTPPEGGEVVSAIPGDEISVTSLDAPAAPVVPDTSDPEPQPDTAAETPDTETPDTEAPAVEEPAAPKPAAQVLCEKTGGQWSVAGESGAFTCVKPTRDGGKVCTKKGDCQGMCLARSGTCAPFMPLFGCNEVLEQDGRRVTLCIE